MYQGYEAYQNGFLSVECSLCTTSNTVFGIVDQGIACLCIPIRSSPSLQHISCTMLTFIVIHDDLFQRMMRAIIIP